MNKIRYIRTYATTYDYIFWIDDDAFFLDLDQDLTDFLPSKNSFLSICKSPDFKNIYTYLSSGQFFIKCDEVGSSFLESIEAVDLNRVKRWWKEELGFFTNGDQDAIVYLLKTESQFKNFDLHHYKNFNSRIQNLISGDKVFILHLTGRPNKKKADLKKAQDILGYSSTLLPPNIDLKLQVVHHRRISLSSTINSLRRLIS